MAQPQELPSAQGVRGGEDSFDSPTRRFRQVVALSALLGLLSGLGETAIDLISFHAYTPDVLYVTVAANLMVFLILGLLFWGFGLGLKPQLAYFLVFFILLWALFHGWEGEFTPHKERDLPWLLSFVGTCLLAGLLSVWTLKHSQRVARIVRKTLPWIVVMVLASFLTIPFSHLDVKHRAMSIAPSAARNLPNIVLIVVDALRADHLSCYHYGRLTSPNFDQLAARGVLFENAIATSSWTLPTHASMLTGLYPNQHRAQKFRDELGADVPTVAEELERAGYRTGAFSGSPFFTPRQGLGRGFMEFRDFSFSWKQAFTQVHYIASTIEQLRKTGWVAENIGQPSGIQINESVIHWIDKNHQPFFLVVNYYEVHEPSSIPLPWRQRFPAGQRSENSSSDESRPTDSQTTPQIQKRIDRYDGAIAYDDDRLQKLMDELGRRRLMDDTLVIVTADHGEGLGEHGLLSHGTALYYPLIHVPLILYWPEHLPAGIRIERPVSLKDLPATILKLISTSQDHLPGKSLSALWSGETPPDQWPMPVSELARDRQHFGKQSDGQGETESIISTEFQFILDPREGPSLYNWQEDTQERENLFHDPRYEAVGRELATELKKNE
jgi:arylsulfatase A-like enzyme